MANATLSCWETRTPPGGNSNKICGLGQPRSPKTYSPRTILSDRVGFTFQSPRLAELQNIPEVAPLLEPILFSMNYRWFLRTACRTHRLLMASFRARKHFVRACSFPLRIEFLLLRSRNGNIPQFRQDNPQSLQYTPGMQPTLFGRLHRRAYTLALTC